jgi:hypothetical protein
MNNMRWLVITILLSGCYDTAPIDGDTYGCTLEGTAQGFDSDAAVGTDLQGMADNPEREESSFGSEEVEEILPSGHEQGDAELEIYTGPCSAVHYCGVMDRDDCSRMVLALDWKCRLSMYNLEWHLDRDECGREPEMSGRIAVVLENCPGEWGLTSVPQ